jgi:HPt (histidine-containing phosphotransfer) domain-containing protein
VSPSQPLKLQTLDQLHALERERPGLMKELIRLFVGDAPRQMRLIDTAYGRRDPEGLRQSAHFLRSGALALGLDWLAGQAALIEHMEFGAFGQPGSNELIAGLRGELHRVLLALLEELKSGS